MRQRRRRLSSSGADLVKNGSSGVRQFLKWWLYVYNGKSFNSISKRLLPAGPGRRGTADQVVGLLFARKGEESYSGHALSAWSVWGQVCWRSEDLLPCVGTFFFGSHLSNNYLGVYWSEEDPRGRGNRYHTHASIIEHIGSELRIVWISDWPQNCAHRAFFVLGPFQHLLAFLVADCLHFSLIHSLHLRIKSCPQQPSPSSLSSPQKSNRNSQCCPCSPTAYIGPIWKPSFADKDHHSWQTCIQKRSGLTHACSSCLLRAQQGKTL